MNDLIEKYERILSGARASLEENDCEFTRENIREYETIVSALRCAQPANEPLTPEQLRGMDFRSYPIWDDCLNTWCVVRTGLSADGKAIYYFGGGNRPLEANRFYRRPPERSVSDGEK